MDWVNIDFIYLINFFIYYIGCHRAFLMQIFKYDHNSSRIKKGFPEHIFIVYK